MYDFMKRKTVTGGKALVFFFIFKATKENIFHTVTVEEQNFILWIVRQFDLFCLVMGPRRTLIIKLCSMNVMHFSVLLCAKLHMLRKVCFVEVL